MEALSCPQLTQALAGASPPVHVREGMSCDSLLNAVAATTVDGVSMSSVLGTGTTCAASVSLGAEPVHGTNQSYILPFKYAARVCRASFAQPFPAYRLEFNTTSATCMPAPEMAYASDIHIHNGGGSRVSCVCRAECA